MLDLNNLSRYQENNRIEAKKALGGLPHSIWETYSAFANTLGGVILLGVEEFRDHSLHTVDLPDPQRLVQEFWALVNNPEKVSANILSREQVTVEVVDGDHIIVIVVPRARRYDRPVYVGGNPLTGSYRRNGEGDYRCTREEVQGMQRDAAVKTQDTRLLEHLDLNVLDGSSLRRYRQRMVACRPEHAWNALENTEFLHRIGAADQNARGRLCPTAAGLLMFGQEHEIIKEFPNYFLDYRELGAPGILETELDPWRGNLFDFYFLVLQRLGDCVMSAMPEQASPLLEALGEALVNCLVNADYQGEGGVVVSLEENRIEISNPGSFRMEVADAISGGVSDPRNAALLRIFSQIELGAGVGSGIPNIFRVWRQCGWGTPELLEEFSPERIVLVLPLGKRWAEVPAGDNQKRPIRTETLKAILIEYLTDHISATGVELAAVLGLKKDSLRRMLKSLEAEQIVVAEELNGERIYRLKQ